jgi:hypothetical protein
MNQAKTEHKGPFNRYKRNFPQFPSQMTENEKMDRNEGVQKHHKSPMTPARPANTIKYIVSLTT